MKKNPTRLARRWAGFYRRDLASGKMKPDDLFAVMREDWDRDEDEMRLDVGSFAEFKREVMKELGRGAPRKAPKAIAKKVATKVRGVGHAPQSRFATFLRGLVGKKPKGCKCR